MEMRNAKNADSIKIGLTSLRTLVSIQMLLITKGWSHGLEGQVLRGAADTLRTHAPFVYYEDSMLPPADQKGALIQRITQPESAGRRLYDCKCANDCFCSPRRGLAKGRHQ